MSKFRGFARGNSHVLQGFTTQEVHPAQIEPPRERRVFAPIHPRLTHPKLRRRARSSARVSRPLPRDRCEIILLFITSPPRATSPLDASRVRDKHTLPRDRQPLADLHLHLIAFARALRLDVLVAVRAPDHHGLGVGDLAGGDGDGLGDLRGGLGDSGHLSVCVWISAGREITRGEWTSSRVRRPLEGCVFW